MIASPKTVPVEEKPEREEICQANDPASNR